jgi:hypothetical protein
LAAWIQNNWRPIKTTAIQKTTRIRANPIGLIWEENREEVDAELRKMLGVTWSDQKAFEQRTRACKRIINRMIPEERAIFESKVEIRRTKGNPPEVQVK